MIKNKYLPFLSMWAMSISTSWACADCPIPQRPVTSKTEAVSLAKQVIPAYKLTSVAIECLDLRIDDKNPRPGYEIDVHEVHSKACGGDEMFSPRVMSIHVKPDGAVSTTAFASGNDIQYKPLVCPRSKPRQKKAKAG